MQVFLFFALILVAVAILFAVQNTDVTTVRFLGFELEGSLALVLLIALALGAMISFFASLPTMLKDKWVVRSQRKKLKEMEENLRVKERELGDTVVKVEESQPEQTDQGVGAIDIESD